MRNLYGETRVKRSAKELEDILLAHARFAASRGGVRAQLTGVDLNGINLANRSLQEADFSGSSLVDAKLLRANLERASLYCVDLRGADLRHANLQFADLRGVSLKGANLAFAKLDNADLRAAMMMYVSADGVSITDRNDEKSGDGTVDFSNCSLKKASFGNAKLTGANFSGALLQGANFKGARLADVNFAGAVLTGVDLKSLNVPPTALAGAVRDVSAEALSKFDELRGRLDGHQQWIVSGGKQGSHCVLDGEDIRPLQQLVVGRPLTGLSARSVVAVGLNFSGCQLQCASFDGADLRDADFTGADLRGASFAGAKIAHANFTKADMRSLTLGSGKVRAVNLTGADGLPNQFSQAILEGEIADMGLLAQAA